MASEDRPIAGKVYPMVYVEWNDPKMFHGWTSKLADSLALIKTVGFLINSNDEGITVVESIALEVDEPWGCSTFIPRELILYQSELTRPSNASS